jgi:hypothetical protein
VLSDASKLSHDLLPFAFTPWRGWLSDPIVDAPLQLIERELGGLSVSLGFPCEPHHRGRNWAFIVAFTVIIALNIGEGIDQGFDFWDWLVIGVSAAFIVQAASRLRSSPELR